MSKCYKCDAVDQLSIKKTNRSGSKVMICRSCRRKDYHASKHRSVYNDEFVQDYTTIIEKTKGY